MTRAELVDATVSAVPLGLAALVLVVAFRHAGQLAWRDGFRAGFNARALVPRRETVSADPERAFREGAR